MSKDYRARISVGFSEFVNALMDFSPGALFPYPQPGTGAHPIYDFGNGRGEYPLQTRANIAAMSLALQSWRRISVHEVVAEFLQGERHSRMFPANLQLTPDQERMIESPNTRDTSENHFRLRLLFTARGMLICEIPPDTQWFEVMSLGDEDLKELRVIARDGLEGWAQNYELIKVVREKVETLNRDPATWRKPILWGHDKGGPFTIVEGNHRLTAYAAAPRVHSLSIPVLVGLSPSTFFFHGPDPPHKLNIGPKKAFDLWFRTENLP